MGKGEDREHKQIASGWIDSLLSLSEFSSVRLPFADREQRGFFFPLSDPPLGSLESVYHPPSPHPPCQPPLTALVATVKSGKSVQYGRCT